jgi:hypothetical protein
MLNAMARLKHGFDNARPGQRITRLGVIEGQGHDTQIVLIVLENTGHDGKP